MTQRSDVHTMLVCDLDLDRETGLQGSMCCAAAACQFWWYYHHGRLYVCINAIGRDFASMAAALCHCHSSITYSSKCCCLHGGNSQMSSFGDKILDLECNFRKLASLAMLQSHITIFHTSLLQIDTEMTAKYGNQRYALSSHWKTWRSLCQH